MEYDLVDDVGIFMSDSSYGDVKINTFDPAGYALGTGYSLGRNTGPCQSDVTIQSTSV